MMFDLPPDPPKNLAAAEAGDHSSGVGYHHAGSGFCAGCAASVARPRPSLVRLEPLFLNSGSTTYALGNLVTTAPGLVAVAVGGLAGGARTISSCSIGGSAGTIVLQDATAASNWFPFGLAIREWGGRYTRSFRYAPRRHEPLLQLFMIAGELIGICRSRQ